MSHFFLNSGRRSACAFSSLLGMLALTGCSASSSSGTGGGAGSNGGSGGSGEGGAGAIGTGAGGNNGPSVTIGTGGSSGGAGGSGTTTTSTTLKPITKNECDSHTAVTAADVTDLQKGGAPGSMHWLYPYDGTVFPRGLPAPVLQWDQGSSPATAILLHLKSSLFDYQICFKGADPAQLKVPQAIWDLATSQSNGATDPLTIELTTKSSAGVTGPIKETYTIALGSLKGVVYYNTYGTPLAGNSGAVMRIREGKDAEPFLASSTGGGCTSCHSVSADGTTMTAEAISTGLGQSGGDFAYDLKGTTAKAPPPPKLGGGAANSAFGAVYPDGSRILTCFKGTTANLIDAKSWASLGGITRSEEVTMAMFAPGGKSVVFANAPGGIPGMGGGGGGFGNGFGNGTGNGTSTGTTSPGDKIFLATFDPAKNTFGTEQVLYTAPSGQHAAFPFFTPDEKRIVFAVASTAGYSTSGNSNLYELDLATKKVGVLAKANGISGGKSYLGSPSREGDVNFWPTVHPIAVGGYAWVFFTSGRDYGNVWTDPSGTKVQTKKKIWVSAVDLNSPAGSDGSHPAFFLSGQELDSGNTRAFSTIAPCNKEIGSNCSSGIDCCVGSCVNGKCGGMVTTCAAIEDHCTQASECCDKTASCIAGICSYPAPR